MNNLQSSDTFYFRLHKAGWSIGSVITSKGTHLVIGTNGENVLHAEGRTESEAWEKAIQEAKALGMYGRWF